MPSSGLRVEHLEVLYVLHVSDAALTAAQIASLARRAGSAHSLLRLMRAADELRTGVATLYDDDRVLVAVFGTQDGLHRLALAEHARTSERFGRRPPTLPVPTVALPGIL